MKHEDKNNPPETPAEENLQSQLKKLGTDATPPESLKKEVFSTLDFMAFFGEVADLFTAKFTETEMTILDNIASDEHADVKEEEEEEREQDG